MLLELFRLHLAYNWREGIYHSLTCSHLINKYSFKTYIHFYIKYQSQKLLCNWYQVSTGWLPVLIVFNCTASYKASAFLPYWSLTRWPSGNLAHGSSIMKIQEPDRVFRLDHSVCTLCASADLLFAFLIFFCASLRSSLKALQWLLT